MKLNNTAAIVLAAGRGTRIGANDRNKVAFEIGNRPMVARTVENLRLAQLGQIIAVVGYYADSVREVLGNKVDYVTQDNPQGTGDAIKTGITRLNHNIDTVLSVYGDDSAFYPPLLYGQIVEIRKLYDADLVFLTINKQDPTGLGRIIRDKQNKVQRIVEEKNASPDEKNIQEINAGLYCFKRSFLEENISKITKNPVSQEYYITDLIEIAISGGNRVETLHLEDGSIWHGVNTSEDLAQAQVKFEKLQQESKK